MATSHMEEISALMQTMVIEIQNSCNGDHDFSKDDTKETKYIMQGIVGDVLNNDHILRYVQSYLPDIPGEIVKDNLVKDCFECGINFYVPQLKLVTKSLYYCADHSRVECEDCHLKHLTEAGCSIAKGCTVCGRHICMLCEVATCFGDLQHHDHCAPNICESCDSCGRRICDNCKDCRTESFKNCDNCDMHWCSVCADDYGLITCEKCGEYGYCENCNDDVDLRFCEGCCEYFCDCTDTHSCCDLCEECSCSCSESENESENDY